MSRVSEVGGDQAPDDWSADPTALRAWVQELTASAVSASDEQAVRVEAAAAAEVAASEASAAGIELAGRRATHAAARRAWAAVESGAHDQAGRKRRVERARRAGSVRALHELAVQSHADADDLAQRDAAARAALETLVGAGSLDDQQVAEHLRTATSTLTEIARVRPLQRQALDLDRQLARIARRRQEAEAEHDRHAARARAIPDEIETRTPALTAAREAATVADALTRDLEALHARVSAARSAATLTTQLVDAEHALREARQARLLARESLVEIREQRLDGMAAEIALKLAVGASCPVCGSDDHPHPASPAPGAPDDATEREARREVDDLEVTVEAHAQQVRGIETRLAAALAESGDSVEHLLVEEEDTLVQRDRARATAAQVPALASRLEALHGEQEALAREQSTLAADMARLDTEAAVLVSQLGALHEQVSAVVPEDSDLDALTELHQQVESLARQCAELAADLSRARASALSTQAAADEVAERAGFDSSAEAAASWLPDLDVAELERQVEQHEREAARVSDLLADDDLIRAAAAEPPDLEALAQAHHRAKDAAAAARQEDISLRDRVRRLGGLSDGIAQALATWLPLRAELDLVADLASLVEGKHPDNRLQMRLSAYVLAHRLGQVVDAANLRLSTMSDQRYSLVHTGQRGAGETRGGLSLLVRDDWTGDSRDPATLSGGETFVVSLALALGLADVITDEAGGTDLETLFVDEGFGSLDAETLEDVMDTLDTLRDGGRVVGVVSHVPELQTRIPTQLRVHRGRHGSHTTLSLA